VCDGWSLEEVMTAEMSAFYRAALAGTPPPLPSLPVQYADFAQWQRQWLQGAVLDSEIAWWKEHLGGEPPALDLPTDRPRPSAALARAATAGIVLPPPVLEALLGLGRRRGGTLFMVLLAVLQATLHRWSGQDRISVGTPVANRGRVELERLIGFFINTLALCTDLSGDPSAGALLERVRSRALAAFDHQDLPFEKLVAAVQAHRDPSRNPLFQVLFVLQNNRSTGLDLPGLTLSVASPGGGEVVSQFDLSISATEAGGALQLGLAYSLDLFDRPTILRLLSHVQQVAEAFAADPDRPLSEIPLLGIPERRQMEVAAGAAGPAGLSDNARPDAAREEIRQRRDQLASRRRQLSPERQALLHKWVSGAPETKAPERPPLASISPLVPIQPMPEGGGGRPPIFLVHPGNGNVSGYLELAKHLGPEQPLYGLQSPGLSGGDILEGMDVIASRYLEALRAFQPHGPYRLGGWSLGGTFAFEMARRLRREHEEVDALLFIDSHGPEPAGFEPADESILLASLVHDFAGVVGQSFEVSQDDLRRLPAEERLDWILDLARRSNILPESFVSEQARRHWEVFRANVRAVESYVPAAPEELPLRTVLFRATTQPPQAEGRPALGWDAWIAGPLEVVPLEGDHYSLVRDPAVRDLAREIAARLAPEEVGVGR
jgi:thioesterase domain-containing protein